MAITRANTEAIIVQRVGPLMTVVGMAVTVAGSNASLNDPIGRAIRDLSYTVTDITSVSDADVAQVAVSKYDEYLDIAEYHTIESIIGNYDDVDLIVGPRDEKLSQTVAQLNAMLARKADRLEDLYGYGLAVLSTGYITLGFTETS